MDTFISAVILFDITIILIIVTVIRVQLRKVNEKLDDVQKALKKDSEQQQ